MLSGAMMHCGANPISFNNLFEIPTPPPTETHFPIPHHELFQLAHSRLMSHGYELAGEAQHFTNREHAHYFSLFELKQTDNEKGYSTMVALRNAHDKTFVASLALGGKVFVCDNLSFSGDVVVGRKHTARIMDELPDLLSQAIKRIEVMKKHQDLRFAEYRAAPLDDRTADHLLMESYRQGIINLTRIGKAHDEWKQPSADHGDKTVWRFFNAMTAALRVKSNAQLIALPKQTIDLHLMLDEFCDVEQIPDCDQHTHAASATVN